MYNFVESNTFIKLSKQTGLDSRPFVSCPFYVLQHTPSCPDNQTKGMLFLEMIENKYMICWINSVEKIIIMKSLTGLGKSL